MPRSWQRACNAARYPCGSSRIPPGRQDRLGDERRQCAGTLAVDQIECIVELCTPVERTVGVGEPWSIGVGCEDRHRPGLGGTVAAPACGVGRRRRGTGHAVPALGETDDLPAARRHLRQPQRSLVRLRSGRQQQHLVERWRQPGKRLGEIDHRPRQHPREQVIEATDHLGHHLHDLRVRMPQHGAHLTTREVEHPPPAGVLHERARRPLCDERRPRRAVAHEMTSCSLQILRVGHRQIIARTPVTGAGHSATGTT